MSESPTPPGDDRADDAHVLLSKALATVDHTITALASVHADQAEFFARIERTLAVGLERIAVAIEAARAIMPSAPAPSPAEVKAAHLVEIRHAIRSGHWEEAGSLVRSYSGTHPDDPESLRLSDELTAARSTACGELLDKLEAARGVNDPERVIELRDEVKPLLDAEALRALDAGLAKWFMMLIQRRLRSGTVKADVAALAGRVAASFDGTSEGASLRASLPTLRRAAGLCARCSQPYTGIADACPACLGGVSDRVAAPSPASLITETDESA